jgi:DNA replication regulator DPB11
MLNLVTNWWVERCLYGKRLVDPAYDVLSRPFDNHSISGKFWTLSNTRELVNADVVKGSLVSQSTPQHLSESSFSM